MPTFVTFFVDGKVVGSESSPTRSDTSSPRNLQTSSEMQRKEKASDRKVVQKWQRQQQKASLRQMPLDMRDANPFCGGPKMDDLVKKITKSLEKHQYKMEQEIDNIVDTPYHNQQTRLMSLVEPPQNCCPHSFNGWNCRFHPRAPPAEYWSWKLARTREALGRAYFVDLFVHWKRYQQATRTLHKQRREELGLTDLAPNLDFPHCPITTRNEKKQLLGKLCLSHKLHFNGRRSGGLGTSVDTCYLCRYDAVDAVYTTACRLAYAKYCEALATATDRIHRAMGRVWFAYAMPDPNPTVREDTSGRRVLHVTHWSEYQAGQFEGGSVPFSWEARAASKRKCEVWRRMSGKKGDGDGYVAVKPGQNESIETWLDNIMEE
ncbi:hypothetical protein PFICI_01054 [Pestalotiopsis fici W106-1]|uniref:Uncharacterized protein n=1 Tax=Pestalotiopsis fici (strain W106-1 / CGMCC3.15140) TaxID=1229662 RepID=W3XPR9_PESFW|nr:uncharacterized protein PFICI_01054 [Pestalotiopsis fici W106-1]ETS87226.1 hypothetical protein PFICI_01054 [Pestalotiopsis fici W106-1]